MPGRSSGVVTSAVAGKPPPRDKTLEQWNLNSVSEWILRRSPMPADVSPASWHFNVGESAALKVVDPFVHLPSLLLVSSRFPLTTAGWWIEKPEVIRPQTRLGR